VTEPEQLAALARIDELLRDHGVEYWLFGGWAVDFHVGSVTRVHHDLDVAVWLTDYARIAALLEAEGWEHTPAVGEDGYTSFELRNVRLDLAFLARDEGGTVWTPLREGRAAWPDQAFGDDVAELRGVRARVMSRSALIADKSEARDDPAVAAKDRADVEMLSRIVR
jgi:aminoglycoside-2''-adenylyltransferase